MCAVVFAFHILIIDHFTNKVDGIQLSCMQFFFVSLFSLIGMLLFESPTFTVFKACFWQIAYVGVFSSGVAYTLQIIAQKDSNPTVVSLLLSLESVFAVIFGMLILKEAMSPREYIGCFIMFVAVILAQIPVRSKNK
jgi:drug/metabolite transporter (DMT)-like permease